MNMALPSSVSIFKQLLAALLTLTILGSTSANVRCIEREREALLDFKKSFVSTYSNDKLSSWKSSEKDCCTWDGITCDNHTRSVVSLDLSDQSLESNQLRPSLLQLHNLRSLNLSFNDFAMRIPEFIGYLSKLKHLDLSIAGFFGKIPPNLGNLTNIQTLNLRANDLSSDTFQWLSHLSSLKDIDLGRTNFSEARDWLSTIKKMSFLSSFSCYSCSLPPPFFSSSPFHRVNSSTFFKTLELSGNILYSSTISWLANSTNNLLELDLSSAQADIFLNTTSLEWLSRLSSLRVLDLSFSNFSHARDCLSTIRKLPLLASFECLDCSFPSPILSSTPRHVNSSKSLKIVNLRGSTLSSSTIFWFLSNSSNLSTLDLGPLNLDGPFPDLFQNMISLKSLSLYGNQLAGEIFKSIGNICNLKELLAYECGLKESLSNVLQALTSCASSSLLLLDMSDNNLTGTIPPMLKFESLTELSLDGNHLHSFHLQNSTTLSKLHVSDISFSEFSNGSLRNTLCLFPASLAKLYLSSNSLTGVLSDAHFTNFSNLISLSLSNNPNLTISFSKPPLQLEYISLSSCKLGPTFPRWLLAQNNFSSLDISNSMISGSIPLSFWSNLPSSLNYLNLSCNNLHGTVPNLPFSFSIFVDPSVVDLSSNALYGTIPFSLFNAAVLILSNNNFSSFAPLPHYNFSVFNVWSSTILDISDNSLSGTIPHWFWSLIRKSVALNLANNYLSGTIPKSIGNTSYLQVLSLSNNTFSGPLPVWLKNCSNLIFLDFSWNRFSGLIQSWMGEELKNLIFLSLKSNNLRGSIPASICHLEYLQILDLSYNNLSGSIPSSVHNITAIARDDDDRSLKEIFVSYQHTMVSSTGIEEYFYYLLVKWKGMDRRFRENLRLVKLIDLSNNNLSEEIPNGITSLLDLKSLDLSGNNLHGSIPEQIGQLKSLEVVNLSYNRLSGHIPSSLASISSLEILNFSHNHLSGRIPTSTQLQSFNASAFADNPGLCGLPLPIKCPGDDEDPIEVPQPSATDGGDKWPDKECFYAGMGTGFAFGFLTIVGALALIRKWRYAFYRSAGDFTNWILVLVELSMSKISGKVGLK